MSKSLTANDIRGFLNGFATSIELDQMWVDALPAERFQCAYDDESWRDWRRAHIAFIEHFLQTVDTIPSALTEQLTRLAIAYDPAVVGEVVRSVFAQLAIFEPSDETAAQFFGWLIDRVRRESMGAATDADPLCRIMSGFLWLIRYAYLRSRVRVRPADRFRELMLRGGKMPLPILRP